MNLQGIAEAYSQVHEKKDSSYLETDMKKRQENNEKARKDMEKVKGQKNPHFEEAGVDEKKKNIRGNDSAEQKARLEKKRGMKLDDHPQFKKEEVSGITAAYQAVYNKVEEVEEVEEDAKYDRNRKRAAQRAADRNAARAAGKTGVVPGVGYVSPRKEKETYVDSAGTTRHKSGAKNEEFDMVDEGLTGARADRARQMQDSDTKSKGGKRTDADRDTAFRLGTGTAEKGSKKVGGRGGDEYGDRGKGNAAKRRMKEDLEATGKFTAEEIESILENEIEEGKGMAALGGLLGGIAGRIGGKYAGGALAANAGKNLGQQALAAKIGKGVGGVVGGATGAAVGAKKGRKGSAAAGGAVGGLAGPLGSGIGGAIASSYEPEGNPIHEVFKDDIKEYAVNEIADVLTKMAAGARDLGAKFGPEGTKIANKVIDTTKSGAELAKKHPLRTAAIGTGVAGLGAAAAMSNNDKKD